MSSSILATLSLILLAAPLCAQRPKPSQHGTVSQEIQSEKISIEYDRPVARGRELFGALVPWGKPWTPGANWATTIELSDDMQMEGQPLKKGRYSIWTIPQEQEWTVIFSKADRSFHTRYPEGQDALRVQVHPVTSAYMETLALYFPVVGPDSAGDEHPLGHNSGATTHQTQVMMPFLRSASSISGL